MSAHNTVRVTSNIMLAQIAVVLGSIAFVAAGSSVTSVSNLHGGSYTYGVDHDNYGAWYGTANPYGHGGVASGNGISGIYGHGALNHGAISHAALSDGDVSYGYETYGPGFGYGDVGHVTSYQNYNLKKVGGQKVLHSEHGVNHGHGATSYQSIYQKTGSGLYSGYGGEHGYSHGNYAEGYGHGSYGGGISSQDFNLNSYVHQPISYDVGAHEVPSYYTPSYGHVALEDIGSYGHYSGDYGHDSDSYNHGFDYSDIHQPAYRHIHDVGNYGYSDLGYDSYDHGYSGYGQGFSEHGHVYGPSYSGLSYY